MAFVVNEREDGETLSLDKRPKDSTSAAMKKKKKRKYKNKTIEMMKDGKGFCHYLGNRKTFTPCSPLCASLVIISQFISTINLHVPYIYI